jgi:hypothetical protein
MLSQQGVEVDRFGEVLKLRLGASFQFDCALECDVSAHEV